MNVDFQSLNQKVVIIREVENCVIGIDLVLDFCIRSIIYGNDVNFSLQEKKIL